MHVLLSVSESSDWEVPFSRLRLYFSGKPHYVSIYFTRGDQYGGHMWITRMWSCNDAQMTWRGFPANTRHSPNVGLMLGQRLRRWPSIKSTLGWYFVLAGFREVCWRWVFSWKSWRRKSANLHFTICTSPVSIHAANHMAEWRCISLTQQPTTCRPTVVIMLAHRLRSWASIILTLNERHLLLDGNLDITSRAQCPIGFVRFVKKWHVWFFQKSGRNKFSEISGFQRFV